VNEDATKEIADKIAGLAKDEKSLAMN